VHLSGQEQEEKTGLVESNPSSTHSSTHHEIQAVRTALEGCKSVLTMKINSIIIQPTTWNNRRHAHTIRTYFFQYHPYYTNLSITTRYVYLSFYIGRRYISGFLFAFHFHFYILDAPFFPFLTFYTYCLPREEGKVWDGISNRPSTLQPYFRFTFSFAILFNTQEHHHWPASIASLYDCLGGGESK